MTYVCKGTECLNFQACLDEIVVNSRTATGDLAFDGKEDRDRLTPVAIGVCSTRGSEMIDLNGMTEEDCGVSVAREFDVDPMSVVGRTL